MSKMRHFCWSMTAALAATTVMLSESANAAGPLNPRILPGIVLSAGRVDSRRDEDGAGTGFFLDANYTRTFINAGAAYKQTDKLHTSNVYAGIGVGKILQLQLGFGEQGMVRRARHDFNLTTLYDFFSGQKRSPYSRTVDNRITFTFAIEEYPDEPALDNASIGFGLLY